MGLFALVCLLFYFTSLSSACTRVMREDHSWKWVRNQQAVPINFKKHNLEVKTDSWTIANYRGRFERMRIVFYNTRGMESGGFFVRFSSPLQYMIPWCSQWKTFPDNLPSAWAERKKTWRISKDKKSLVVTSNGVEVVNFTASNETCDKWPNWSYFWEKETVRVKFTKFLDYASDEYRLQLPSSNWDPVPKGVKFNVNSDLRRSPLEISTSSELGSKDEISILFYDEHENPSGGLKISFSKRPRFAIPHCRWYTNFYRASLKKLLEMPQEKVWAVERSPAGIRVQANGEKVLNFALSDTSCRDVKSWSQFWSRSVHKVKFLSTKDTASESCRLVEPPTIPPAWRKDTVSPERGGYDMSPEPPSEAPTKHFRRDTDNCWMDGVQPINTKMILTKAWESEEHCESLCRGTIGCHAIFKKRYDIEARRWLDHERCELFGEYDLARNGTYFHREVLRMAERKCFDPDHYTSENSSNPCGAYSWECKERCIELDWRCDGERDCEGGEDEESCEFHVYPGPFCGPDLWKCPEFHLCPEDARCKQCIPEKYLCDRVSDCYFKEDERPENCQAEFPETHLVED